MSSRRILYYCQSLVGIGHLSASLRVIEQLLGHGAQVDLVQGGLGATLGRSQVAPAPSGGSERSERGGTDTNQVPVDPNFRRLVLPTLLHDTAGGGFVDPDADEGGDAHADLGAVWAARSQAIDGFLRFPYDAVVLEFWPFGRRRSRAEIMAMLGAVRERCGHVPVFTSVRDVLIPRPLEKEQRMVASVRKHIHTVFVRGDPDVIRFDETFTLAPQIADRLVYTGYIAPPSSARASSLHAPSPPRHHQVLVTQGGGNVGRELLEAAIGVAARMPELQFVLAAGARASAAEIDALRARATSANVDIRPFLADFPEQLRVSVLSINMGGDNTLLDVLAARTPSLAYPYQANPEQGIRIAAFAKKGLVHALTGDDLVPERLKARIEHALAAPPAQHHVAMDGARVTSERILSTLDASDQPDRR